MSISIYFNPLDTACKNIIGGVKKGDTLQLNVFLLKNSVKHPKENTFVFHARQPKREDCCQPMQNAFLRINRDGENAELFEMTKTEFGWSISFEVQERGLYFYSFYLVNEGNISCGDMQLGYLSDEPQPFQLTVFSEDYQTPEWFKGGVMYQIFPDRFCKVGTMPDINGRIKREDWGALPSFRPNDQGKVLNNDFFGGNFKGIESKLPYL